MVEGARIAGYSGVHLAAGRRTSIHRVHMLKVLVPLEGELTYTGGRVGASSAPLVVPADHAHAARCDGVSVCFLVDAERYDGRLRTWSRGTAPIALEGGTAARMRALAGGVARALATASESDVASMVDEACAVLFAARDPAPRIDARVLAAVGALGDDPRPDLGRLAREVGLSPHHLAHRVKAELGVPLSRVLLFRRLLHATRRVLAGAPLAAAARDAGFSDQAHFSRTTRGMLGQPASFVAATAFKTGRPSPAMVPAWPRPKP